MPKGKKQSESSSPGQRGTDQKWSRPPVTWAECTQTVITRAMELGQLPTLCLSAIIFLIVYKMSPAQTDAVAREVLAKLAHGKAVAYPALLISWIGWYIHARLTRRSLKREIKRIGQEKSFWQEKAMGHDLASSDEAD